MMATRTTTSIGPNFSKDGVLHVISELEMNLPGTAASRLPSVNLTCTRGDSVKPMPRRRTGVLPVTGPVAGSTLCTA